MRSTPRARIMLQIAGGLIVGGLCLWLSLRGMRGAAILDHIARASFAWVLLAVIGVILVAAGKALRWMWLFPASTPAPRWTNVFGILMTSQMLNLLVPIRLGEIARLGLMRQEGVPVGTTLGTIVLEKSLDLLAVGLLVVIAVPLAALAGGLKSDWSAGGLAIALGLLAALALVSHFRVQLLTLFQRIPTPRQRFLARIHRNLLRLVSTTLDSIAVLEGPHLSRVLALTAVIWLLSVGGMVAMLIAFGEPLDFGMALVLMFGVMTSNLAPAPPALIGVIGAVAVAALTPFGVPQEVAVALGAVLNVVLVAPPVLLGSWAVWLRLLSLREDMNLAGWRHAFGLGRHAATATASDTGKQE